MTFANLQVENFEIDHSFQRRSSCSRKENVTPIPDVIHKASFCSEVDTVYFLDLGDI